MNKKIILFQDAPPVAEGEYEVCFENEYCYQIEYYDKILCASKLGENKWYKVEDDLNEY